MRQFTFAAALLVAQVSPQSSLALQDPTGSAPTNAPRICVANLNSEIKQASDTVALRDRLASYLRSGALVKETNAVILVLNGHSDQSAASEVRDMRCDFAIYTRALVGKLAEPRRPDTDRIAILRTVPENPALVPGLQFTVVRVSSGIPVQIDRVFMSRPYEREEDIWLLLRTEQERIELELLKRLAVRKPAVSK